MTYSVRPAPAGLFLPDAVLDALGAGLLQLAPVYADNDPGTLVALTYEGVNAVAQRLFGLPDQPTGFFGTTGPQETALFSFCRATFWSGEAGYFAPGYVAADGARWQVVAQRHAAQLLVSFTQGPAPATAVEALLEPQPAALAADELVRKEAVLRQVLTQTPVAVCILQGPEHRFEYVNPAFTRLFANRSLVGLPIVVGLPEAVAQGFIARLNHVYATGEPFFDPELALAITQPDGQPTQEQYVNFTCQVHPLAGHPERLSIFAIDVTAQVHARQQHESRRQNWQRIVEHSPVAIAELRGPAYVLEQANDASWVLWDRHPAQGLHQPFFSVLTELADQGLRQRLDEVLATGESYVAQALPTLLDRGGRLETVYLDIVAQPLYGRYDQIEGVILALADMSEQIAARRQIQNLNEELRAANEELLANNEELARTQCQLQQLNAELETRVAAGIAEAQVARAEAEQERERLEHFFQQAPVAICVHDGPDLVYELLNPSYQALFPGRPLLGQPLREALPEILDHPVWQQLQRVYATGETHEEASQLIPLAQYAGGPLRDCYLRYVLQARYDTSGRIDGVLAMVLDITAQVRVQQQAERLQEEVLATMQRRAQERESFYQIFEQTPAVIALLRGPEQHFEYFNPAYQALFPGRALRGLTVLEALPETGPQGFVALLDQVYQTGETFVGTEVPFAITNPAGGPPTEKRMNFTYQAYRESGAIVGVSVFATDVTEQVLARQQREAGLRQLHTIFEQAPVALALLQGPEYIIEVANPTICQMWGRERAAVLGQPLFAALPEIVDQGFPQLLAEVRRTGIPFVAEEYPAQLLRHGQLETACFRFVYQPLLDATGGVKAIAIVATDVSALVTSRQQLAHANEELRTTNAQLTHTNTDLDNFIYTASHDLKAPIANIESLLLLLRKQLPAEAQQVGLVPRVLGMMQESVERFRLTIAQLTDLTQVQQVRTEPAQAVDLAAVIEAVRLDLAPLLEATGAQLTVDIAACETVQFAPQHLRSIVYNLLSNAVKYHHPDRVPQVQLRCRPTEKQAVLEVQDNGLGLSQSQQAKLFNLFQRLHVHVEGSGVGLYMVKRIVENAGGTITVHSELGVGSTFTVSFPA